MKRSDLVFVGLKGSVIALNRGTGEKVWVTHLKGSDFVNVVVQDELVLASCYGEVFCLEPLKGAVRWHSRLKGFGEGMATIAFGESLGGGSTQPIAAKRRQDDQAAAAAMIITTASS